jgi:hypothetical protein
MRRAGGRIHLVDRDRPERRRWIRLAVVGLACVLGAACTGTDSQEATRAPEAPARQDYWPTAGWKTAAPAEQGMDPAVLDDLDTKVPEFHPQVRSVLVVRHGYLVYERYWQGVTAGDGHDVRSVTRALSRRWSASPSGTGTCGAWTRRSRSCWPSISRPGDPRLRQVTLEQLLTMTSGLAGDDSSLGGDDRLWDRMFQSPDWVRYTLGRRLETAPGESFAYSSATSHLLSAIVADSSGQSTMEFARQELFGPLGIAADKAREPAIRRWPPTSAMVEAFQQAPVAWPTDPQGYHFGGAFLKLPARDLAKLGYLYLNGGRWDGTQVIPAEYVAASTRPQSDPSVGPGDYGYQWWVTSELGYPSFFALGYGGQTIRVIPKLDLVAVVTSDPDQERYDAPNLVVETIVPAVTS